MSLPNGTRIGSYEITGQLGKGGMGDVYRATDSRLKRAVALKVLPPVFSTDPERMARFEREARVLAALNHPHIASIYGVEERALVMELVDGPTLQDRINAGPIPLDDALPILSQIADALQYAHDKGVVHRDLKPANVKFTSDGEVKILDFGLAKALDEKSLSGDPDDSPTMSLQATRVGVILGTASYMAPEQARGRQVDHRADVWAFGVVIFEMLTGKRLFKGEDLTETLASVVKEQADLSRLPERAKPLVAACIEKDPRKRLNAIGDWRHLIPPEPANQPQAKPQRGWKAAVLLLAVALTASLFQLFRTPEPSERSQLLSVPLPPSMSSSVQFLDISPDGRRLLLVQNRNLFLRPLASNEFQPLTGAVGRAPFWSFDGRSVGYFSEGKLRVVPATGGPSRELCGGAATGSTGTWGRDNVILFQTQSGQIHRVAASGGECTLVGADEPGVSKRFPAFLPDGNHYFYTVYAVTGAGVYLTDLQNTLPRKILADVSSVVYVGASPGSAQGHLLFRRDTALLAQPFDERVLEVVGDPFVLVNEVAVDLTSKMAAAAAADGTLVYVEDNPQESQLTWMDRSGIAVGTLGSPGRYTGIGLSPKGTYAVAKIRVSDTSLRFLLFDLIRGTEPRFLTPSGATAGALPVWSQDENSVLFTMRVSEGSGLYRVDVATGRTELLEKTTDSTRWDQRALSDWSPDGKYLIYSEPGEKTQADIWSVSMESSRPAGRPTQLVATESVDSQGQISPDGKWLAFVSGDDATIQGMVRSLQDVSKTYAIPGTWLEPRFAPDGSTLYFPTRSGPRGQRSEGGGSPRGDAGRGQSGATDREGRPLLAVSLEPDGQGGLRTGKTVSLPGVVRYSFFAGPAGNVFKYSPHPDGRFLVVADLPDEARPTIQVITNARRFIAERQAAAQVNP